jgi:small subunit ribosomal protein S6
MIISSKLSEDATEGIINKFKELVEKNGEFESMDRWGKRRLAYPIRKETEGIYVLFNFKSLPAFPAELDRISKITDDVLRTLIIRKV